mgnify:FL=1
MRFQNFEILLFAVVYSKNQISNKSLKENMLQRNSEISKFEQLFDKFAHSGEDFIDPDFPPQHDIALSNHWNSSERSREWRDVIFANTSQIFPREKVQVISDQIQSRNICQGELGDCYLLSALSVLAEHPYIISRLFLVKEHNTAGIYCIWLCDSGEWRPVLIDDYFPVRKQQGKLNQIFSHSVGPELWVSLLEKAYAKIHGSYENIEGGFPEEALRDFTGAPFELIWREQDPDKLWRAMVSAFRQGFLVAGCTPVSETAEERLPSGLLAGYAYSVVRCEEVVTANGRECLVQLRNPWGDFKWNGDWGAHSLLWTEKLKKQLGVTTQEESVFWISVYDYVSNFEATCIVKFNPEYDYYSTNLTHSYESHTVLRVAVTKRTEITFSINQKDARGFMGGKEDYQYSCARILVARTDEKQGLVYVTGAHGQERNLQASAVLEPGVYILTLEVHWQQNFYKSFNFSAYTQHPIHIEGVENADLLLIQKNIIKNVVMTNPPENQQIDSYIKLQEPDAVRKVGYIHGLIYYYYENHSKQMTQIVESVEVQGKNLKICRPYTDDTKFELVLPPEAEELILYKIISSTWSWKTMYTFVSEQATIQSVPRKISKYLYFDDPSDAYKLAINTNYNQYIKTTGRVEERKGGDSQFSSVRSQRQASISQKHLYSAAQINSIEQLEELQARLLAAHEIFVDDEFPPETTKTVFVSSEEAPGWESLKYRRLSGLYPGPKFQILGSEIQPTNVKGGDLGNNYFLSSLAILAENPKLIERLFIINEPNSACIYAVWLCVNGDWKPVIIDDNIPTKISGAKTVPAFAHSTTGEGWVALLEKAYAKVHGNYKAIENGWPEEALRDLTGAPYEVVFREQDTEKVWKTICEAKKSKFLVACCSPAVAEDSKDKPKFAPGFAFSVLDAREVTSIRGKERIICVRNVWNPFEWDGDWGPNSSLWPPQLKKDIGPLLENHDCVWLSIYDYMELFEATTVLKYRPNYYYSSVQLSSNGPNAGLLRIKVYERSDITIAINQKDRRSLGNPQKEGEFQYACGRILVGKVGKDGLGFVAGAHGQERNLHASAIFEPGDYIVSVEVHWQQDFEKEFNVSFYTGNEIGIEGIENADALKIQKNIIRSMILDSPPDDQQEDDYAQVQEPKAKRIMGYAYGILYYYYINRSTSNTKINETAMVSGKNLHICYPFQNDEKFEVELVPNDEILVIYKITSSSFSWKTKYSFTTQKVKEYDQVQFQAHSFDYLYQDNPSNRYDLHINTDYNKYLREGAEPREKVSKKESPEKAQYSSLQEQNAEFPPHKAYSTLQQETQQATSTLQTNKDEAFGMNATAEGKGFVLQDKKRGGHERSPRSYDHTAIVEPKASMPSNKLVDKGPLETSLTSQQYNAGNESYLEKGKESQQLIDSSTRTPIKNDVKENSNLPEFDYNYPGMDKAPKIYPEMEMKFGQFNSQRIKYTNYDGISKKIEIYCSNSTILNVKTPVLEVGGYGSDYIRLRFIAPRVPGRYIVTIELRVNGSYTPEEVLRFPINCT